MNLSKDKVARACFIAQELLKQLTVGDPASGKPVISIEQLQDVVEQQTRCKIEKSEVAFEGVYLRGRIERWDKGKLALIHIRMNQEHAWKRFVAAKEILHVKIDMEEDFSPYGDVTLDELIRKGHFGQASIPEFGGEPAQSEVIAEIAALEVLYPLSLREADADELFAQKTTRLRIAHKYGIPPNYAATALDVTYLKLLAAHIDPK